MPRNPKRKERDENRAEHPPKRQFWSKTTKGTKQKPRPTLFSLPFGLRQKIYGYVLHEPKCELKLSPRMRLPPLFKVNDRVATEALRPFIETTLFLSPTMTPATRICKHGWQRPVRQVGFALWSSNVKWGTMTNHLDSTTLPQSPQPLLLVPDCNVLSCSSLMENAGIYSNIHRRMSGTAL